VKIIRNVLARAEDVEAGFPGWTLLSATFSLISPIAERLDRPTKCKMEKPAIFCPIGHPTALKATINLAGMATSAIATIVALSLVLKQSQSSHRLWPSQITCILLSELLYPGLRDTRNSTTLCGHIYTLKYRVSVPWHHPVALMLMQACGTISRRRAATDLQGRGYRPISRQLAMLQQHVFWSADGLGNDGESPGTTQRETSTR
jgi:hypothetical protein